MSSADAKCCKNISSTQESMLAPALYIPYHNPAGHILLFYILYIKKLGLRMAK